MILINCPYCGERDQSEFSNANRIDLNGIENKFSMPLNPFIIKNTKEPTNKKQNLPITQITLKDNHKGRVKIIQILCPI